ncbi:PAS domain S-box protein [Flavobacterium aestivum]|uniref:PAS domain S-box protein n=1 Tax=Flavobacterium aestivum TaxID=3003257 RepID=UPI002483273C|nr:PAS domain S-box protein [Flavobacterium aestivum]
MINKIKASVELSLLIFIMLLFIVGIGVYSVYQIKNTNSSSHELYTDRMLPMGQLGAIRYYSASILSIAQQANGKQITFEGARKKIREAQDTIIFNWKSYSLTYLTQNEKQIAVKTSELLKKSNATVEKLILILEKEDAVALNSFINKELFPAINPVLIEISNLLKLQLQIGQNIDRDTLLAYRDYINEFLLILLIIFIFVISFSYYMIKKIEAIINVSNLNNEKLVISNQNYRNLIEYAGEAIFILDENKRIIDVNDYASKLFGYTREEFLKIRISDLIVPQELEKEECSIKSRKKNECGITFNKIIRKDGREIDVEINNRLMEGNGVFAIIRDITDRNRTEELIKQSEQKYHYLFDNNPACIIIWDLETLEVVEVNEAVFEKYGYSREEWNTMSILDCRPLEDHQKIRDFANRVLNSNETKVISKNNLRHLKKNGEEMLMEIASHKIVYNNRQAILSLGRDVTEQTKFANELRERRAQIDLFIEHSPVALAMLDIDMKYITASRRWMSDYNIVGQEIIGKSHYEIFPGLPQDWKDVHQRCLKGAIERRNEDSFIRADGSIEWIRWEVHPWYKATDEIGGIIIFAEILTESKQAAEMFKKQFENSPDIILYVNKYYKIEAINRDSPMISKEDLIGMDCISVLPPESQQIAREALEKCFETGESLEIENALTDNRWTRSRAVPVVNNGEVTHVMIFSTDVTERKRAEQKLLQSEEKYRALTDNISDAIVLVNEKFEIEYQSPSAENISGYSFNEVKFKSVFNFMHPDEFAKEQAFFNEAYNSPGVPMQNQFRIIHKDGHVIWTEGTVTNLLQNENIGAFILNYRDITNRKKFDEQLALTASIVNSSDDAIISKSIDGTITSWNVGAEKVLGYSSEETIGKHISMLVPLESRGEERNILAEIRKGKSVDHYETQRMKKNGQIIDVSLTVSPIRDTLGNVIGASKIMRDISDRKSFENDLIRYNTELKKANLELDRFVYSASHDLRAPLKSMLGLIHITKDDVEPENTVLHDRLSMLNGSIEKLDSFIEEILQYSRNARMDVESEIIDFEKLIQDIKESHKFMDGIEDVKLHIEIKSNVKLVSDYRRLRGVLSNICSNAIKYRDVSKEFPYVNVLINCNKNRANFTIEDNGVGIADKDKEKIFEMFYRATTLSTGSGLGLYIVKETLEKLGGKIFMESELKKGTRFSVEVPNQVVTID